MGRRRRRMQGWAAAFSDVESDPALENNPAQGQTSTARRALALAKGSCRSLPRVAKARAIAGAESAALGAQSSRTSAPKRQEIPGGSAQDEGFGGHALPDRHLDSMISTAIAGAGLDPRCAEPARGIAPPGWSAARVPVGRPGLPLPEHRCRQG